MGKHKDKSKKHKHEKHHRSKKEKKKSKKHSSSSESSSSADEWVEKHDKSPRLENDQRSRDAWMSLTTAFSSTSNTDRRQERDERKRKEREDAKYNPRTCPRELNPYWREGGDGLPQFKKPSEDDDTSVQYSKKSSRPTVSSGWRKQGTTSASTSSSIGNDLVTNSDHSDNDDEPVLSDKELNVLAAKLVKAEILGNTKLINELKEKLDRARRTKSKSSSQKVNESEDVLLTQTDSQGRSRPMKSLSSGEKTTDNSRRKKQRIETHKDGERVRFFADDDKYTLNQMFENEKFNSVEDQNMAFIKMAGKVKKNDDLDDVFSDNIRNKESDAKVDSRNRSKAIAEHQKVSQSLDNCRKCIQSDSMAKHLMVSMGDTMYLSLPSHEPLTDGHCLIVPIRHVSCATQLDENEWTELMDIRRALTKMFLARNEDVIYIETASFLHRYPHMSIECIPLPKEEGDLAPIYFKKAIDESEIEWTQNKKLISMKGKDVRRTVPKGLPYFSVSFGMEEGYAHVIEDEQLFPGNFGQEVVGGMLDLHHSKWRKPQRQNFDQQSARALEFSKEWNVFDCTNKS